MQIISVEQPWATMLVMGLKTVQERTWTTDYRGPVLIHAAGKKVPSTILDTLPLEWANEIVNMIWMGGMPDIADLPRNAVIGMVNLDDVVEPGGKTGSMWDGAEDTSKFVVSEARVFAKPITDVNGKPRLWDYPLETMPEVRKPFVPQVRVQGSTVVVPLAKAQYDFIINDNEGVLPLLMTDTLLDTLTTTDANGNKVVKALDTVELRVRGGRSVRYTLPYGIQICDSVDDDGNAMTAPGLYSDNEVMQYFAMELGEKA